MAIPVARSSATCFGAVKAVADLSIASEAGRITGVLGPNGAGKTMTSAVILGLVAPTSGHALVFGLPHAQLPRAPLRVGAVPEASDVRPGPGALADTCGCSQRPWMFLTHERTRCCITA